MRVRKMKELKNKPNKIEEGLLSTIRTISIIVSFMLIPIIAMELAADESRFGFKDES